jgi:hypothetical protein
VALQSTDLIIVERAGVQYKATISSLPGGGSGDSVTKLASDFVNATVTFNDITGLTYTPPANSDFEVEAWLLIMAGNATTNLPRIGISIGAGQQYGAASIEQVGATTTTEVATHGTFLTTLATVQVPAGGVAAISTPYEAVCRVKGRSGASPGAIKFQLAAETAASNAAIVKAGSSMKTRTV